MPTHKYNKHEDTWANPWYNGRTLLTLLPNEPEVTCNNCPDADECPGFDACVFLAANCKHKQKGKEVSK